MNDAASNNMRRYSEFSGTSFSVPRFRVVGYAEAEILAILLP